MDERELKILLVEDNEDDYIIFRELLGDIEAVSFDLMWAMEYDEGLQIIERDAPDVCLVDYRLGEYTGLDLLRAAREVGCQTPVIMLTGQGDHEIDMLAMEAGAADYLVKDQLHAELLERSIRHAIERRRHAEAMRESEERFRATFEQAAVGIALISVEGHWLRVNQKLCDITGYSREELLQLTLQDVTHPDDLESDQAAMSQMLAGEIEHYAQDKCYCCKDGTSVWTNQTLSLVREASGGSRYFIAVIEDITGRKEAEESVRAKDEEMRSMSQQLWQTAKLATMGELVASIAHELNNPMATVMLHIESLLLEVPADDEKHKPLSIVEQEVERMSNLVAHLLQFSRRSQQQVSTLDMSDEIEKTLELMQSYLRNRNVAVERDFKSFVPPVQADRQQLRQLFLNLMTNACDAMPEGGTLTLRVRHEDDHVITDVCDTGMGIEPENLAKVMEPFFTTKPEGKGTGLGLAICRRIVSDHGGTFGITSEVGQGTTISVAFPVVGNSMETDGIMMEDLLL